MIDFASEETAKYVRQMWEVCFNDSDDFIDLYFSEKYDNKNTIIYFSENKPAASLQMLPYKFTFYNNEILSAYISGACTLPNYRNKGYMSQLLKASFEVMQDRNIPLSILIPAEKDLYYYYEKYGYEKVFEGDDNKFSLKELFYNANKDYDAAYKNFDKLFRGKDFCVQKTKEDFITVIKDLEMADFPEKTNLSGMARIIDVQALLSYFAAKYPEKIFTIEVKDDIIQKNNGIFEIVNGNCNKLSKSNNILFVANINTLCQLLFGYQLEKLSKELSINFESQHAVMNLMLE